MNGELSFVIFAISLVAELLHSGKAALRFGMAQRRLSRRDYASPWIAFRIRPAHNFRPRSFALNRRPIKPRLAARNPAGIRFVPSGGAKCRFDYMQQHTGRRLLSAVFEELFHLKTVSFHLGVESATIDIEGAASHDSRCRAARANQVVFENRPEGRGMRPVRGPPY
jgi:hypothetical protein